MSEEKKEFRAYDLQRMEDLFECVEIITMARGALYPVDAALASRLEKVSDALSAFAMNIDVESLELGLDAPEPDQEVQGEVSTGGDTAGKGSEQDPFDLLSDFPVSSNSNESSRPQKKSASGEDEEIIDIITGERIK
ncbi:MAG: hypothetical protein ACQES8_00190 [Thermodesulfobacteriota bacterium]